MNEIVSFAEKHPVPVIAGVCAIGAGLYLWWTWGSSGSKAAGAQNSGYYNPANDPALINAELQTSSQQSQIQAQVNAQSNQIQGQLSADQLSAQLQATIATLQAQTSQNNKTSDNNTAATIAYYQSQLGVDQTASSQTVDLAQIAGNLSLGQTQYGDQLALGQSTLDEQLKAIQSNNATTLGVTQTNDQYQYLGQKSSNDTALGIVNANDDLTKSLGNDNLQGMIANDTTSQNIAQIGANTTQVGYKAQVDLGEYGDDTQVKLANINASYLTTNNHDDNLTSLGLAQITGQTSLGIAQIGGNTQLGLAGYQSAVANAQINAGVQEYGDLTGAYKSIAKSQSNASIFGSVIGAVGNVVARVGPFI
jgi:hypothetical protein